jgi:ComF family protein
MKIATAFHDVFYGVRTVTANMLFPSTCLLCKQQTDAHHSAVCTECFHSLQRIVEPCCARCSQPFPYAMDWADEPCEMCQKDKPEFDAARAVWQYDAQSTQLIRKLKYADHTHLAPYLGRIMRGQGAALLEQGTLLAPVPLHPKRLLHRRYNQAMLLAKEVHRTTPHIRLAPTLLQRTRHTLPQTTLSQSERKKNVAGVFRVNPDYRRAVLNEHIILVDDVMTTGATVNACTRALKDAGAAWVGVLTLAKRCMNNEVYEGLEWES